MTINIELENLNDALNPFNKNTISEDLDNYILNNCHYKFIKNTITLNIKGLKTNIEKEQFKNLIITSYEQKLSITKKLDLFDNYFRITLLIIGIIAILISQEFNSILSEIFLIAGWVVTWEAFYDVIFNEIKRKRNRKIFKSLVDAKFIYN